MPSISSQASIDHVMSTNLSPLFRRKLQLACGLCFASDGIEITLLSFLSFVLKMQWGLTNNQTAWLTSSVFLGMLTGSLFWGPLADAYGRRPIFFLSCCIITFGGFLSGLMPTYDLLCFSRFAVGIGVGGLTIPFDILAEFTPTHDRAQRLLYLDYFWSAGAILVPILAWNTIGVSHSLWRVFVILCSIPCGIACVLAYKWVPESPQWLTEKGRLEEADLIIKKASGWVGDLTEEESIDKESQMSDSVRGSIPTEPKHVRERTTFLGLVKEWKESMTKLRNFGWERIIPIWVIWFCFGYCYYGFILTISKVFASDEFEFEFRPIMISCFAEIIGTTIAILLIDHPLFGRMGTSIVFFSISAPFIYRFCVYGNLLYAFVARVFLFGAVAVIWVATPEMFPTEIRATGHGSANSFTRIGAMVAPFSVSNLDMQLNGWIFVFLIIITLCCLLCTEETLGKDLDRQNDGEEEDDLTVGDSKVYYPPELNKQANEAVEEAKRVAEEEVDRLKEELKKEKEAKEAAEAKVEKLEVSQRALETHILVKTKAKRTPPPKRGGVQLSEQRKMKKENNIV